MIEKRASPSPTPSIVFIDDEPGVLDGLRRALHPHAGRWNMRFERTPATALSMAEHAPPAVVITDLRMPDMDGAALIAAMRPLAPRARYIMLSGTADFDAALAAINECRIFRLLTKPCDTQQLRTAITDALDDQRQGPDPTHITSALGAFSDSVIVVDRANLHIAFSNPAAQSLVDARDGVLCDDAGRLRALRPEDTKTLARLVRDTPTHANAHLRLPRRHDAGDLHVSICPADRDDLATLIIADPEARKSPGVEALQTLFDLSAKEALIVDMLCQGGDLDDAAAAAELTISSARTYLKRIFAKTGATRQTDLVRLALSSPNLAGPLITPE